MNTDRTEQQAATVTIQIGDLLRHRRYQIRKRLDGGTVSRYAASFKAGVELPPVKVALIGGSPTLVDGYHRVAALERLGSHTVEAVTVEASDAEACWMAAQANLEHGLPLKPSEVREAFKAYVRARKHRDGKGGYKSYRQIGRELGKSHHTVKSWMHRDFPKTARLYEGEPGDEDDGGLRRMQEHDLQADMAREALGNVLAAFRGVSDDGIKSRLIWQAEQMLQRMKDGRPWEPFEVPF